jgi:hypothetical protein
VGWAQGAPRVAVTDISTSTSAGEEQSWGRVEGAEEEAVQGVLTHGSEVGPSSRPESGKPADRLYGCPGVHPGLWAPPYL